MKKLEKHEIIETEKSKFGFYDESKVVSEIKSVPKTSNRSDGWYLHGVQKSSTKGAVAILYKKKKNSLGYHRIERKAEYVKVGELSTGTPYYDKFITINGIKYKLGKKGEDIIPVSNKHKRKRPIAFKRTRTTKHAPKVSGVRGPGKGWHKQSLRHSKASVKGWKGRKR